MTGASRGIGRELALQLAAQGARLALAARTKDRLEAVAAECRERGASTVTVSTDVTSPDQCQALVTRTVAEWGCVDTLVNNAGITMAFRFDELADLTLPDRIMRVNYVGSLYCTHFALPHLRRSRGRIVGVASLTGRAGVPLRSLYAASKHAMAGFFDSLRIELADTGVSVTMIYPDFVQTEVRDRAMGPDGRPVTIAPRSGDFMTAEDCAARIVKAAARRRREIIMGARGKVGMWLKVIAPGAVDAIARKAIRQVRIE